MLYLGEGAKKDTTAIASSSPMILRFALAVLKKNHNLDFSKIRCELHLRMDQDAVKLKLYWSEELRLPLSCFNYVAFDKRSTGKPTCDHYKGVCILQCGNIAIQRKLIYLYNLFCEKVIEIDGGT